MAEPVSRLGTARVLVLLGSGMQLAAAAVGCFLTLAFGPVLRHQPGVTGSMVIAVVVFVAIVLLDIALANLLALRAGSVPGVVAGGCGVLVLGTVLGIGALLLLAFW
jgi:hypothetical protein